ncbi:hypothetical protein BGW39_010608 [Mortierella sp. 14UC]|nr:hypothetical protein BGW39_010608 [Mortierella sp. 14UC]
MSRNKGGDVTWSEENDADLCDDIEDTPNPSQVNNYANPTATDPTSRTRHHPPNPPVSTVMSEPKIPVHDLRTMLNRMGSSSTGINSLSNIRRSQPNSEKSTTTISHAAYSEWKSETDWRTRADSRTTRSTDIERRWGDLRNDIEASKLAPTANEDFESPDTLTAGTSGSAWTLSSRPVASGIKLVAVRNTSTQRPALSSGRPSASDLAQKVQESVKGAFMEQIKEAVMEQVKEAVMESIQG